MVSQEHKSPIISWGTISAEITLLRRREPFLNSLLSSLFRDANTLSEALAAILANSLQTTNVEMDVLKYLFCRTLADDFLAWAVLDDLTAVRDRDPACTTYLHALLNYKGFQALQAYRIAHKLWNNDRAELALWISNRVSLVLGPDIHPAAKIGSGIMLDHGSGIVIGETTIIEDEVSILHNVTLGGTGKVTGDRHPKVRRGVMIGAGAKIIGNIEIGEFSKVAAGSVVLKSVPAGCTVAGVPAQVVRVHDATEWPSLFSSRDGLFGANLMKDNR